jgi:hypothetical protein
MIMRDGRTVILSWFSRIGGCYVGTEIVFYIMRQNKDHVSVEDKSNSIMQPKINTIL